METPDIVVTSTDHKRLSGLLDSYGSRRDHEFLQVFDAELARARIVAPTEVPPDVVTMNSRFRYIELTAGTANTITLVYPWDADPSAGRISVFAPVGCALLGLRVGQTIDWQLPDGRLRSYGVVEMLYQPEAAGDFHL